MIILIDLEMIIRSVLFTIIRYNNKVAVKTGMNNIGFNLNSNDVEWMKKNVSEDIVKSLGNYEGDNKIYYWRGRENKREV
jgi:hypothetical protein